MITGLGGRMNWEIGLDICTHIYIKVNNCSILCNDLYGKNMKKWMHVYVQLIHFSVRLHLPNIVHQP